MVHSSINIPGKPKGQGSLDLQLLPQHDKDEDKLKHISSSTVPAARQMKKSHKVAFNQFFFALDFNRLTLILKMIVSASNLICCL